MSHSSGASVEVNLRPAAANPGGPEVYGPERRPRSSSPRADPTLKVPAVLNVRPVSGLPSARVPPPAAGPICMDQMQRATVGQAKGDGRGTGRASLASDPKSPAAGVEGSERGTGRASLARGPELPETGGGPRGSGAAVVGDSADGAVPVPEGQGAVGVHGPRLLVANSPPVPKASSQPPPRDRGASAWPQGDSSCSS